MIDGRCVLAMLRITVKRVYDPIDENDGVRVLVDRVWPRGMSKQDLRADQWLRDVAPVIHLQLNNLNAAKDAVYYARYLERPIAQHSLTWESIHFSLHARLCRSGRAAAQQQSE